MKIIQKRLNNTNTKNSTINNNKFKNIENIKKYKPKENNITINNRSKNIISNLISKSKKKQNNKKGKLVNFSINNKTDKNKEDKDKDKDKDIQKIKNNINNINNMNYTHISTPPKSLNKKNKLYDSKLNSYNISNYKKNIVHRHTKSLYNQETTLLTYFIKDMNNTDIINIICNNNDRKLSVNKNNNINSVIFNNINNNTKSNFCKKGNKTINKNEITKINKNKITKYKKSFKTDFIKHKRQYSDKGNFTNIIEELKLNNNINDNNCGKCGLTKKFIAAQNNWRLNYFATVIQKIYRGYFFRKSDYKKYVNNQNIKSIYIRKKAKDSNHKFGNAAHRKCPTEENLLINNDIIKKNSDSINSPPKIKEIIIMRNIKKNKFNNNSLNNSNEYFNNYMHNYNDVLYSQSKYQNQNIFYKIKNIFDKWKFYSDKKKILYYLKLNRQIKKKRNTSYKKKNENNYYINFHKSCIKKVL